MCLCICGFSNAWVCVCADFVMCGCVYVFVCLCICGFSNAWVCVCVGVLVICLLVFTVFCIV